MLFRWKTPSTYVVIGIGVATLTVQASKLSNAIDWNLQQPRRIRLDIASSAALPLRWGPTRSVAGAAQTRMYLLLRYPCIAVLDSCVEAVSFRSEWTSIELGMQEQRSHVKAVIEVDDSEWVYAVRNLSMSVETYYYSFIGTKDAHTQSSTEEGRDARRHSSSVVPSLDLSTFRFLLRISIYLDHMHCAAIQLVLPVPHIQVPETE
jgi:hypothetical protein